MLKSHILRPPMDFFSPRAGLKTASGLLRSGKSAGFAAEIFARHSQTDEAYPEALMVFLKNADAPEEVQAAGEVNLTCLTLRLALQLSEYIGITEKKNASPMESASIHQTLLTCLTALETRNRETVREIRDFIFRVQNVNTETKENALSEIKTQRERLVQQLREYETLEVRDRIERDESPEFAFYAIPNESERDRNETFVSRKSESSDKTKKMLKGSMSFFSPLVPTILAPRPFRMDVQENKETAEQISLHKESFLQIFSSADRQEQETVWQVLSSRNDLTVRQNDRTKNEELQPREKVIRLIEQSSSREYIELMRVLERSLKQTNSIIRKAETPAVQQDHEISLNTAVRHIDHETVHELRTAAPLSQPEQEHLRFIEQTKPIVQWLKESLDTGKVRRDALVEQVTKMTLEQQQAFFTLIKNSKTFSRFDKIVEEHATIQENIFRIMRSAKRQELSEFVSWNEKYKERILQREIENPAVKQMPNRTEMQSASKTRELLREILHTAPAEEKQVLQMILPKLPKPQNVENSSWNESEQLVYLIEHSENPDVVLQTAVMNLQNHLSQASESSTVFQKINGFAQRTDGNYVTEIQSLLSDLNEAESRELLLFFTQNNSFSSETRDIFSKTHEQVLEQLNQILRVENQSEYRIMQEKITKSLEIRRKFYEAEHSLMMKINQQMHIQPFASVSQKNEYESKTETAEQIRAVKAEVMEKALPELMSSLPDTPEHTVSAVFPDREFKTDIPIQLFHEEFYDNFDRELIHTEQINLYKEQETERIARIFSVPVRQIQQLQKMLVQPDRTKPERIVEQIGRILNVPQLEYQKAVQHSVQPAQQLKQIEKILKLSDQTVFRTENSPEESAQQLKQIERILTLSSQNVYKTERSPAQAERQMAQIRKLMIQSGKSSASYEKSAVPSQKLEKIQKLAIIPGQNILKNRSTVLKQIEQIMNLSEYKPIEMVQTADEPAWRLEQIERILTLPGQKISKTERTSSESVHQLERIEKILTEVLPSGTEQIRLTPEKQLEKVRQILNLPGQNILKPESAEAEIQMQPDRILTYTERKSALPEQTAADVTRQLEQIRKIISLPIQQIAKTEQIITDPQIQLENFHRILQLPDSKKLRMEQTVLAPGRRLEQIQRILHITGKEQNRAEPEQQLEQIQKILTFAREKIPASERSEMQSEELLQEIERVLILPDTVNARKERIFSRAIQQTAMRETVRNQLTKSMNTISRINSETETQIEHIENVLAVPGKSSEHLEQIYTNTGHLIEHTRNLLSRFQEIREWTAERTLRTREMSKPVLPVVRQEETIGLIAEAPVNGFHPIPKQDQPKPKLRRIPEFPEAPELAFRQDQTRETVRQAAAQAAEQTAALTVERQAPELHLLRRQDQEHVNAITEQKQVIANLQTQVSNQQKLLQKAMEKAVPKNEPAQIRAIAKEVMKEMESRLRLERQRHGMI